MLVDGNDQVTITATKMTNTLEKDDHDSDDDDDERGFLPKNAKAAPAPVRRRLPRSDALPRSSSFRKPKNKRAIRRGVSFNETGPQLHRVESVKSLLDFDDKEVSQLWYDEIELETSKTESYALVEQVETPHAKPLCKETETLRGLESKTEEGSMTSFMNRVNAIGAVLDHQEEAQQKSKRSSDCGSDASLVTDDEELASLASMATEDARKLAHDRALQDEKEAWEYLHGKDGEESVVSGGNTENVNNNTNNNGTEEDKKDMVIQVKTEKEAGNPRPKPKRQSSLKIPSAFASTSDAAVPGWVKPNTAEKKKKPIGRSKSFTPETATKNLLLGIDKNDMSDSEDEEDLLNAVAAAVKLTPTPPPVPRNAAPGRIQRRSMAGPMGSATATPTPSPAHVRKVKKPMGRSKSLNLETAAATMGLELKKGGPAKKSKRLEELKAKAVQNGSSLAPDTS